MTLFCIRWILLCAYCTPDATAVIVSGRWEVRRWRERGRAWRYLPQNQTTLDIPTTCAKSCQHRPQPADCWQGICQVHCFPQGRRWPGPPRLTVNSSTRPGNCLTVGLDYLQIAILAGCNVDFEVIVQCQGLKQKWQTLRHVLIKP